MKATLNDIVIAENENTVVVEGNHYFPIDSMKKEDFEEIDFTSLCGWNDGEWHVSVIQN